MSYAVAVSDALPAAPPLVSLSPCSWMTIGQWTEEHNFLNKGNPFKVRLRLSCTGISRRDHRNPFVPLCFDHVHSNVHLKGTINNRALLLEFLMHFEVSTEERHKNDTSF